MNESSVKVISELYSLDLVDEMQWEDIADERGLLVSLVDAGYEEDTSDEPLFGVFLGTEGSIYSYTEWFYDGDTSAFATI
jgi:hypothetical protein